MVRESGDVQSQLGSQLPAPVINVDWADGWLRGTMKGDIGTEDAARRPYSIDLSLRLRGSALNGGASAVAMPSKRAGFALTQWVELTKH
jgi:hypothetical protein